MKDDNHQSRLRRGERVDQSLRLFFTLLIALTTTVLFAALSVETTMGPRIAWAQPSSCGNGFLDSGEDCDLTSPSGAFCQPPAVCNSSCDCVFLTTTSTPTTTTSTSTTVPEHFQCYEVKPSAFVGPPITAIDQFGTVSLTLRAPNRLCPPASKNAEPINDATEHVTGYRAKAASFSRRFNQTVVNQFGSIQLDVIKPDMLMLPTAKDGVAIVLPAGDHFTCYKVKRSRGTPKFVRQTVTVADQFQTVTETLIKPVRLCAPTNKNGGDPTAPSHPGHLLCYKAKSQVKFGTEVHTITNQFGTSQVTVIHRKELCVPSLKNPGATTTSTTIQATTTTSSTVTTSSSSTVTTSSSSTVTTSSSTTSTTLYGSPSRAFIVPVRSLFD